MRRYENISKVKNDAGKEVYTTITFPEIPFREDDLYIVTNYTDRLDAIAYRYYGNPRYWWIIASVNNLGKGTLAVEGGIQLRIPINPDSVIKAFNDVNR